MTALLCSALLFHVAVHTTASAGIALMIAEMTQRLHGVVLVVNVKQTSTAHQ